MPKKQKVAPDVEVKKEKNEKPDSKVVEVDEAKAGPKEATEKPIAEPQPIKLPSQAEIMKNPMKYIGEAVTAFQQVSQMAAENREALMQIANHMQASDKKLAPLVNMLEEAQARQKAAAQAQGTAGTSPSPPQGQGGLVGEILKAVMANPAPQANPWMQKMMGAMFEKTMTGIDLSNALTKVLVMKIGQGMDVSELIGVKK